MSGELERPTVDEPDWDAEVGEKALDSAFFRLQEMDGWRQAVSGTDRTLSLWVAASGGGTMLLGLSGGRVVRWSATGAFPAQEIPLGDSGGRRTLRGAWIDPSGMHAFVCIEIARGGGGEEGLGGLGGGMAGGGGGRMRKSFATYYLHADDAYPRVIESLTEPVSSICFVPGAVTPDATGEVLVGTASCMLGVMEAARGKGETVPFQTLWKLPTDESYFEFRQRAAGFTGLLAWRISAAKVSKIRKVARKKGGGGSGGGASGSGGEQVWILLGVVPGDHATLLYEFVGGPSLLDLFQRRQGRARYQTLRAPWAERRSAAPRGVDDDTGGSWRAPETTLIRVPAPGPDSGEEEAVSGRDDLAPRFGVLSAAGVVIARVDFVAAVSRELGDLGRGVRSQTVMARSTLFRYPNTKQRRSKRVASAASTPISTVSIFDEADPRVKYGPSPSAFIPTPYHILLIYPRALVALDRAKGLPSMFQPLVTEDAGEMIAAAVDEAMGSAWLVGARVLFQLVPDHEDRELWRGVLADAIYAASTTPPSPSTTTTTTPTPTSSSSSTSTASPTTTPSPAPLFARARRLARRSPHPAPLRAVLRAEAEWRLGSGDAEAAARAWARSGLPLERVALRLLRGKEPAAPTTLRVYLSIRLAALSAEAKVQRRLLAAWIVEVYLAELSHAHARTLASATATPTPTPTTSSSPSPPSSSSSTTLSHLRGQERHLARDLVAFLKAQHRDLDSKTMIELVAAHGRTGILLEWCRITGDHDRVIAHHLQRKEWIAALRVIEGLDEAVAADLLYQHSPILVIHEPIETTRTWKLCRVDGEKLVPALVALAHHIDSSSSTTTPTTPTSSSSSSTSTTSPSTAASDAALEFSRWYLGKVDSGSIRPDSPPRALAWFYFSRLTCMVEKGGVDALVAFVERQVALEKRRRHFLVGSSGGASALARRLPVGASLDLEAALRVCVAMRLFAPAATLASALGLHEEGVRLALGSGPPGSTAAVELAKKICMEVQTTPRDSLPVPAAADRGYGKVWSTSSTKPIEPTARLESAEETVGRGDELGSVVAVGVSAREHASLVRTLWLEVVASVAQGVDGAKRALAIMKEANDAMSSSSASAGIDDGVGSAGLGAGMRSVVSGNILSIEDLLPLLPPSTSIGEFKEEVKEAVESCQLNIRKLEDTMTQFTEAADETRTNAKRLRERHVAVEPGQVCMFCGEPLLSRPLYLFPTGFGYHCDCLITETFKTMSRVERARVDHALKGLVDAESEMVEAHKAAQAAASDDRVPASRIAALEAAEHKVARARRQVDDLVAREDPLCGDYLIDKIEDDFPPPTAGGEDDDWSI